MPKPRWRIWYEDGTTWSDLEGPPWKAPGPGVVAVVFADNEIGRAVVVGADWYVWTEAGGWIGVMGPDGLVDHVVNKAAARPVVKQGRQLPRAEYARIKTAARLDPDFPKKTNARADETPR